MSRKPSFIGGLVPDWRPTRTQVQSAIRIAVVVVVSLIVVLFVLYLIGRRFDITLLNLLKVLAVPITVGAAVPLINWLQKIREQDVEKQRAQDEALQAYFDHMSQLLTDKQYPLHRERPGDRSTTVARARTLTILPRLDGSRKASIVRFLYESSLITKDRVVLDLHDADLIDADLSEAILGGANLSETDLREADLKGADLNGTNLRGADLYGSNLSGANLSKANLLGADLSEADLSGANLFGAGLFRAKGWTEEQLTAGKHLAGATMPNGKKYEAWLQSKSREGDREESGP